MYPYNYSTDDGSAALALILPLFIAVYISKYLSHSEQGFFKRNYWWICALCFVAYGSTFTSNEIVLLLYGGVGALGGLIGASGFDGKKSAPDSFQKPSESVGLRPSIENNGANQQPNSKQIPSLPSKSREGWSPKDTTSQASTTLPSTTSGSSPNKKFTHISSHLASARITESISGNGWYVDEEARVLWNPSTGATLSGRSGLGYSVKDEYFTLHNRVAPRRIRKVDVAKDKFTGELDN